MKTVEDNGSTLVEREQFGTLFKGNVVSRIDSLNITPKKGKFLGIFPFSKFRINQTADEFGFRVLSPSTVNILVSHRSRRNGGDADLRLFRDDDGDGKLDVPFEPVIDASLKGEGRNEFINRQIPTGDYIIGIVGPGGSDRGVEYFLRVEITDAAPITINPLPTIPRI